jgi:hypothetical protein
VCRRVYLTVHTPLPDHSAPASPIIPTATPHHTTQQDIAFEIGRFYYGIREYDRALAFYQDSSQTIGEHHVTFHNMGLCHYSMGAWMGTWECG